MASPDTLSKRQKFRGGVWAVAFAAVIMVGALTGAQLKSDKQKEQVSEFLGFDYSPLFFYLIVDLRKRRKKSSNIPLRPSGSSARSLPLNKSPCLRGNELFLSTKGQVCRGSWTCSRSASKRDSKSRRIPRNDSAVPRLLYPEKRDIGPSYDGLLG